MPRQLICRALGAGLLLANGAVLAATCNVPSSHASLLAAVNDTGCDPIVIAAGEFPAAISINRSLSLVGAGASATRLSGAAGIPTLTLGSAAVITITGLELATTSASNLALRVDGASVTLADIKVGIGAASAAPVTTVSSGSDGESLAASFSRDGRYVVFQSRATNLAGSSANGSFDIYRIDRNCAVGAVGCTRVQRVSLDDAGAPVSGDAIQPALSADGNLVVFVAADTATAKVRGESLKQAQTRRKTNLLAVFLRNMQTGRTDRVGTAGGSGNVGQPQIAPGGGTVVFTGDKPGGVAGSTAIFSIPLIDSGSGPQPVTGSLRCVSCKAVASDGSDTTIDTDGSSAAATASADGQWVAFETTARNAMAGQTPTCPDAAREVMLRNMLTGVLRNVSAPVDPAQCGAAGSSASAPRMDYAGSRLVFESNQPLTPRTTPPQTDAYLVELHRGGFTRLSQGTAGVDANAASRQPTISGDGQSVAYVSAATNLDAGDVDNNLQDDLFVRSLRDDSQRRVNKTTNGDQANAGSNRPALDYGGSLLVFDSQASNLASGATGGISNVFEVGNPLNLSAVFTSGFE